MTMRRAAVMLCCALGAGCGGEMTVADGGPTNDRGGDTASALPEGPLSIDAPNDDRGTTGDRFPTDDPSSDITIIDRDGADGSDDRDDGGVDAAIAVIDRPAVDAVDASDASDASAREVFGADSPVFDATSIDAPRDVPDAGDTRPTVDGPAVSDVGAGDVFVQDVRPVDVGIDVPRDAPTVDATCAGAGPSLTVASPTSAEVIETCSTSGVPVFYDFTVGVMASARVLAVGARWITPDGAEAPPPATLSAAPLVFHRQVGGPSAGAPALSVFGLRGVWQVEFTVVDACGRRATVSQSFSLTFTTRRCPNP